MRYLIFLLLFSCNFKETFTLDNNKVASTKGWTYGGYVEGDQVGNYVLKKSGLVYYEWDLVNKQILLAKHTVFWDPASLPVEDKDPNSNPGTLFVTFPQCSFRQDNPFTYTTYRTLDNQLTMYAMSMSTEKVHLVQKFYRNTFEVPLSLGIMNQKYYFVVEAVGGGRELWVSAGRAENTQKLFDFAAPTGTSVGLLSNYLATPSGIYFFYSDRLYYLDANHALSDLGAETSGRMIAMGDKLVLFKNAEIAIYNKLVKTTFPNPTGSSSPSAVYNKASNKILFGTAGSRLYAIDGAGLLVTSPSLTTGTIYLATHYGDADKDYLIKADRLYLVDEDLNLSMVSFPEPLDYMDQVKGKLFFQSKSDFSFVKYDEAGFTALGVGHFEKLDTFKRTVELNEWSDPDIIMGIKMDISDPNKFVFSYYEFHTGKNEVNLIESYEASTLTGNWVMSYLRESIRLLGKLYATADYRCSLSSY